MEYLLVLHKIFHKSIDSIIDSPSTRCSSNAYFRNRLFSSWCSNRAVIGSISAIICNRIVSSWFDWTLKQSTHLFYNNIQSNQFNLSHISTNLYKNQSPIAFYLSLINVIAVFICILTPFYKKEVKCIHLFEKFKLQIIWIFKI